MSAGRSWESSGGGGWESGSAGPNGKEGSILGGTRDSVEVAGGTEGGMMDWSAEGSGRGSEVLELADGGGGMTVGSVRTTGRNSGGGGGD